jgi:hypothetical protein
LLSGEVFHQAQPFQEHAMANPPKKLEPWEVTVYLVLTFVGILASVAFPPLWLIYIFGGCYWLAYQGAKRGRKD